VPGLPPVENHERRCQAKSRVTLERCRRWALKDQRFCQFHGGRRGHNPHIPTFYRHKLGPTLRKAVDELLSAPHADQVQLYEELALARMQVQQVLALIEPAMKKQDTAALGAGLLHESLSHVRDMCLAVSRIEKDADDKVSLHVVDSFIVQILRAVYRACGDAHADIAKRIEEEIETSVRLPVGGDVLAGGTTLTPDQVVKEMDASVNC